MDLAQLGRVLGDNESIPGLAVSNQIIDGKEGLHTETWNCDQFRRWVRGEMGGKGDSISPLSLDWKAGRTRFGLILESLIHPYWLGTSGPALSNKVGLY